MPGHSERGLLQFARLPDDGQDVEKSPLISAPAGSARGPAAESASSAAAPGVPARRGVPPRAVPCRPVALRPAGLRRPVRPWTGVGARRAADRRHRRWFGAWLNRPRRVLLALAAVWVISVFDLGYTLAEHGESDFVELNPLAAHLLRGPAHNVMAYKFGLLGLATAILVGLRRYAVAELACWFLLAVKVYVALRWLSYFDCLLRGYVDPLIAAPWTGGPP